MANKIIYRYEDIEDRIFKAVDTITMPIASTLSPKGNNVIYEDDQGNQFYTNDGYTIASHISVKGDVENAIIEIIKGGSRKTNLEVGDGTSSTVVASSVLIKGGLTLVRDGHNQMDVRDELIDFASQMKKELSKRVVKVKTDADTMKIATISASGNEEIAKNVCDIVKIVGEDGQVMIDRGFAPETEIIEDSGFVIRSGLFAQELGNKQFQAKMEDVPILITDKRLYYKSEAETILSTVLNAGYNEVVIVAQEFMGEALPYFIANHANGKVRVILVAEKKLEILEDLATFVGGEVISDKKGSLVDNVTIENFAMVKKVFTDPAKTIIARDNSEPRKEIDKLVTSLKKEMKKNGNKQDPNYVNIQRRVSSLTNGMVTIKVGGYTDKEIMEKIHRYEDSINAVRAAIREGYLPGAGVSMLDAFNHIAVKPEFYKLFKAVAEANVRQIATNCGKNPEVIINEIASHAEGNGLNANTGKVENVLKAGIIEPYLVTSQVIDNAVSIANIIITSRYLVVNDLTDLED